MNRIFKNIIAFVLLLLFLIPTAEQTFHALYHSNDEHCNTLTEQHFHEQEHHCSFCDFNFVDTFSSPDCSFNTIVSFTVIRLFSFSLSPVFHQISFEKYVRGPPFALSI